METQRTTARQADGPTRRRVLKTSAFAGVLTLGGFGPCITTATRRVRPGPDSNATEDRRRTDGERPERAPVVLEDGSKRYFQYDLDTGAIADWEETDRNDVPVWHDDRAVHWIDTSVREPDAVRPALEITIYQEVVFTETCGGDEFAHPALTPEEWAREDTVSNADLTSWLLVSSADEVKAAFDRVTRQLDGAAVETPPEKYGVSAEERRAFRDERHPGACRIRIVGIDPTQVVQAGVGPLPEARNGAVTVRIPELPERDWERLSLGDGPTRRPHQLVLRWEQVLTEPIAVTVAPRRRIEKLLARESCDGE